MVEMNIIIGNPLVSEELLGIEESEQTVRYSFSEVENEDGHIFLPHVLVTAGLFKNTSEVRRISADRAKSTKITDDLTKILWRTIESGFEFTQFKVGKKVFTLVIGAREDQEITDENLYDN